MIRLLILIVGVVLVAGCGAATTRAPLSPGAATTSTTPTHVPAPTTVSVPSIGARSSLIPLGLTPEGALEVPPVTEPLQAGWYAGPDAEREGDEVKPGEVGPGVIAGHVAGGGQPGIFHQLHRVTVGDSVFVDRADTTRLRFVVYRTEQRAKDTFPTEAVYGDVPQRELRLITCGGEWNRETHSYEDNRIVFAVLAP